MNALIQISRDVMNHGRVLVPVQTMLQLMDYVHHHQSTGALFNAAQEICSTWRYCQDDSYYALVDRSSFIYLVRCLSQLEIERENRS